MVQRIENCLLCPRPISFNLKLHQNYPFHLYIYLLVVSYLYQIVLSYIYLLLVNYVYMLAASYTFPSFVLYISRVAVIIANIYVIYFLVCNTQQVKLNNIHNLATVSLMIFQSLFNFFL